MCRNLKTFDKKGSKNEFKKTGKQKGNRAARKTRHLENNGKN